MKCTCGKCTLIAGRLAQQVSDGSVHYTAESGQPCQPTVKDSLKVQPGTVQLKLGSAEALMAYHITERAAQLLQYTVVIAEPHLSGYRLIKAVNDRHWHVRVPQEATIVEDVPLTTPQPSQTVEEIVEKFSNTIIDFRIRQVITSAIAAETARADALKDDLDVTRGQLQQARARADKAEEKAKDWEKVATDLRNSFVKSDMSFDAACDLFITTQQKHEEKK